MRYFYICVIFIAVFAAGPSWAVPVCYKAADPNTVTAIGKTTPGAGETCFEAGAVAEFDTAFYVIDHSGPSPRLVRKTAASIGAVKLDRAKAAMKRRLELAAQNYIRKMSVGGDRYPEHLQTSFLNAYRKAEKIMADPAATQAMKDAATAVMAKLAAVDEWVKSVVVYHYSVAARIQAAATMDDLRAVTWDFSAFDKTDPDVKLIDVML